jgi:glycosyltransferase-like protein
VTSSIRALADAVDTSTADVVHAQDCISANAVPGCIRTVHHIDRFTTPELVACHDRAIRTPIAHVCVSRAVADELVAGWGYRAAVIPNGVDAGRFAAGAADEEGRAAWRARIGRPYLLAVGGIEPRKGTLDLVETYARVRAAHADHALVIAGGETLFDYRDYRAGWEKRAAELGVTPVVLGPVDDAELPSLVAAASVFAFPSVKEGFGLAPLEALAAGVPLVVSDLPVFREIFGDAASYAANPTELARKLHSPPDLADRGRSVAARYTWEAAATAHLEFYLQNVRASGETY